MRPKRVRKACYRHLPDNIADVGSVRTAEFLEPPVKFITTKIKPISEICARDIPPGLDAEDVGWYPGEEPEWYKKKQKARRRKK